MAADDEFVRVSLKNGLETSVSRAYVEGLTEDEKKDIKVLADQDPYGTAGAGRVAPTTRKGGREILPTITIDEAAAAKESNKS